MTGSSARVAILISGSGSNMEALADSMGAGHPGRPVLVLSNRPEAGGLAKAEARGIRTAVIDHRPFLGDRASFEAALSERLEAAAPDVVCLAGFMRVLTPGFIDAWAGKMLNIHPSLLPKFCGLDTHARALAAGETAHGCTVHEVTAELDGGPILGQARLAIREEETAESLAARVLPLEHRLYPAVLRRFIEGERAPLMLDEAVEG
ncbi:phosphoribosylglycinamide formyltransferase [Pseudoroseicyclus sp. CXY001]|uniref:phosphoribosylglycinamide formyltransferase n=1 Tax=Pseudoroseicyclus sp. CXY001 TaxID=3242492 RepID=UPI00358DC58D